MPSRVQERVAIPAPIASTACSIRASTWARVTAISLGVPVVPEEEK